MFFYTLRRIVYAIPIALAVSLVCFMLVHIAPGDPIDAILPPDASAETVAMVRKDYGLDRPLPVQFGLWLGHVVQGDFGLSLANRRGARTHLSLEKDAPVSRAVDRAGHIL
jgi:peptide/nickel transport system permease protein